MNSNNYEFLLIGGGDNWVKLELSFAHLPRGDHGIYKHILFYWYPTFFAKKKTLGQKTDLEQFSEILLVKYPIGIFNSVFSNHRSILEQNV